MKMMITACLLVRSQRKGVSFKEGKAAAMTCGIVSPTMIQKANMPPKALGVKCSRQQADGEAIKRATYKAHWATCLPEGQ